MATEEDLIRACKEYNSAGQKLLYYKFAPRMKAVCLRYASDSEEAKDIMQESFIKVFSKIHTYSSSGSLEGWIRRIVVNTAINHYNKNKKHIHENIDSHLLSDSLNDLDELTNETDCLTATFDFSENELMRAINILPEQYRIVFNLFHMENISHKEISELLNIEEKTSRTRLFRGKKILQKHLYSLRKSSVKEVLK